MPNTTDFQKFFTAATGNTPFPWQKKLFEYFSNGEIPVTCNLPTGLGKTSVVAIWLIALANHPDKMPRRLVYVVNRRTVVDQTTDEVEKLRNNLQNQPSLGDLKEKLGTLAISTLRGQYADNGEWRDDPARPAVICGTVDMIGSGLLFSGYRCGFKSKPTHAGLLGQDTLIVHDEAHLEPAFQNLLESIHSQQRAGNKRNDRCIQVMELTATSRTDDSEQKPFSLTAPDYQNKVVEQRISAKKGIRFHAIEDSRGKLVAAVVEKALEDGYKTSGKAILIYLRKVEDVNKVVEALRKQFKAQDNMEHIETLTGTLRGKERDELVLKPIFQRFLPESSRLEGVAPQEGTVYLVCTSAGEVGVNISADHLICDLTPFDSMAQRFGRVNRFGEGDANIDIIHETEINAEKNEYEARRFKTLELLRQLPLRDDQRHDACPDALGDRGKLTLKDRLGAFSPQPTTLHVDDILFDGWAMTTIYDELPGRPAVADWLHGVEDDDWDPPQTQVAWRREVGEITGRLLEKHPPQKLLEDYPLKSHELLRDRTDRVFKQLQLLAKSNGDKPVWVVNDKGKVEPTDLKTIVDSGTQAKRLKESIQHKTILLPANIGGLEKGLLNGSSKYDSNRDDYDVADEWNDEHGPRRLRYFNEEELDENNSPFPKTMRKVRTINFNEGNEETDEDQVTERNWIWCVRPKSADPSWRSREEQLLADHLKSAEEFATRIVAQLELYEPMSSAIVIAAKYHDLGKDRKLWQNGIGNRDYSDKVLAKSKNWNRPRHRYRHEFGSLLDIREKPDFQSKPEEMQELILHLIAAHHGRGRPHFPEIEASDPEHTEDEANALAAAVPRHFARLQRRYGRWGLAYLESLVRAADVMASQSAEDQATRKKGK